MATIAFTGHRPPKLGGYGHYAYQKLLAFALLTMDHFKPIHVISGMALGWDTAVANAAYLRSIPFTSAIPCRGYELNWPMESQDVFKWLLERATVTHYVCEGEFHPLFLKQRNRWMVDNCDFLVALCGDLASGTGHCIRYAESKKVKVENVWEQWEKFK